MPGHVRSTCADYKTIKETSLMPYVWKKLKLMRLHCKNRRFYTFTNHVSVRTLTCRIYLCWRNVSALIQLHNIIFKIETLQSYFHVLQHNY